MTPECEEKAQERSWDEMRGERRGEGSSGGPSLITRLRGVACLVAASIGAVLMIAGFCLALKMALSIMRGVRNPESADKLISRWERTLGGKKLDCPIIGEKAFPLARPLAVGVVGVGAVVLAWLGLGMIVAGGNVVSATAGDRLAIKRIVGHAMEYVRDKVANQKPGKKG